MLRLAVYAFSFALTLSALSIGSSFAQSNPTLDCTPYRGTSTC
jgi:hypothetical protein